MNSFGEFLSKLFGGALIKVDQSQQKNFFINIDKPIQITKDGIFIDGKKVGGEKEKEELLNEIRKYKKEESFPFQLIHKDLEKDYSSYQKLCERNTSTLKILRKILPLEEIECILIARRIQLAYNENKGNEAIKNLELQLNNNFPKKGKKVANLIKAGYFDEIIIPMIDICKAQYPEEYKRKFNEFYQQTLKFFPLAIFVNNEVDFNWIIQEIEKRLKMRRIPLIKIHTMGNENISKVEKAIKEIDGFGKFTIEDKRIIGTTGIIAQTLEIKVNKNFT